MTQEDVFAILRHLLTTAGGALTADGLLSSGQLQDGVGAIMVLVGLGWSLVNKWEQRRALAAATERSK
jgi:hypothetical protein